MVRNHSRSRKVTRPFVKFVIFYSPLIDNHVQIVEKYRIPTFLLPIFKDAIGNIALS